MFVIHGLLFRKESLLVFCVILTPACARVNYGGYPAFWLRVDSREPAPRKCGTGMTHTQLLHCQSTYVEYSGNEVFSCFLVIPAKAGIQCDLLWIPACAGMTNT
jgi:hypothetical protein